MPSMDDKDASRRFRELSTTHPPPPQAPSDPSTPQNRHDSSESESGSVGGLSGTRQPPRSQQPQFAQGVPGANEYAQNPDVHNRERADNAYATIRARSGQHGPTGYAVSIQGAQYTQEGGRGQGRRAFPDYSAPALSLLPSTASPQVPDIRSSHSSSPAESVGSQLSRHSGSSGHRSSQDVSHGPGTAGYLHRAQGSQMGAVLHAQGPPNTSPQSISPENLYIGRAGFEPTGFEDVPQRMPDYVPQRPPVHRFTTTGSIAGPPLPTVFNLPRHIQGGGPYEYYQPHSFPQTPQLDFSTRQLSLEDNAAPFIGHLQPQQPHGSALPTPPPPMGPMGMGNVQQSQLPLTHVAAADLGERLTLDMLSDSAIPGEKPNYPYPTLIKAAILGSPRRALTLQGIYKALEDRFEWFRIHRNDKAWQNSIRHNLSLNKIFRRLQKPITEPGKGSYWTVDSNAGEGTKRGRKRTKRAGRAQQTAESDAPSSSRQSTEHTDSEEGDTQSVSTSHSQSQPPAPYDGRRIYQEEPSIDPALLYQSHFVGQGRTSQRSPRASPLPYARPAFPMQTHAPATQDPRFAALGQFSVRPGQTTTFGSPPSGQPAVGQGPAGFDPWEASFMAGPPPGAPTWGTQASAPPTLDMPVPPADRMHHVGYQPHMPGRGRPARSMTSGTSVQLAGAPGVARGPSMYRHGVQAVSAETVASAGGTSSSSASEAGSARNIAGPSVPQVYRRQGSSSSLSSSQG